MYAVLNEAEKSAITKLLEWYNRLKSTVKHNKTFKPGSLDMLELPDMLKIRSIVWQRYEVVRRAQLQKGVDIDDLPRGTDEWDILELLAGELTRQMIKMIPSVGLNE